MWVQVTSTIETPLLAVGAAEELGGLHGVTSVAVELGTNVGQVDRGSSGGLKRLGDLLDQRFRLKNFSPFGTETPQ